MLALKILNERLADLERIQKMYQSTQVQNDILETKMAIDELEDIECRLHHAENYIKELHEPKEQ